MFPVTWCYVVINDAIVFVMLKCLFRDIMWLSVPVLILVPALVSFTIMILLALHVANAYDVTGPKSHIAPHLKHLDLRNSVLPIMMPLASPDASDNAKGVTWQKKSSCPSVWLSDVRIHWYHLCLCWHDVIPMLMPMTSHDEKSNVVPHIEHLDLRDSVVPLMMQLALYDASTKGDEKVRCHVSFV